MNLEWPLVALEPFLFVGRAALERLCNRLEARGLACSRLELALRLEPDGHVTRSVDLPAPTRDVKTLLTLVKLNLEASPPGAPVAGFTFAAHPERIPADAGRELVLGWIDSNGYDGANRAMRTHIFDPAGYPEDVPVTIAWAEKDGLVGPPKPERRPAGARFLVLPGVGHTPMWDDPELVARTLLEGSAVSTAA
jgi:pimeloyl-ACP methyl ester carboxylesterase